MPIAEVYVDFWRESVNVWVGGDGATQTSRSLGVTVVVVRVFVAVPGLSSSLQLPNIAKTTMAAAPSAQVLRDANAGSFSALEERILVSARAARRVSVWWFGNRCRPFWRFFCYIYDFG